MVTVVGLGLIGGSMAITLKENGFAGHVIGVDQLRTSEEKALRRCIIDEALPLDEAVAKSDLVLLATPVDVLLELVPRVLDMVAEQVVIDFGSTKQPLVEVVRDHPKRGRYVAAHAVALARHLSASVPMRVVELEAGAHDLHAAYVSHISHISSFALALTVLAKEKDEQRIFELASGGFSSTVRLAKSSADMWVPIFRQNREYVLDVLDEHINQLARFRSLLIKKDFDAFYRLIEEANDIKRILDGENVRIELADKRR